MINIKSISLSQFLVDSQELHVVQKHHDEVEPKSRRFDPDLDWYKEAYRTGILHLVGVYDIEKLVGYSIEIVANNPHYRGKLYASNDLIYLHPDYRHLGLMLNLLEAVVSNLKGLGAVHHQVTLKQGNPCKSLMMDLGYDMAEVNWHRELEK